MHLVRQTNCESPAQGDRLDAPRLLGPYTFRPALHGLDCTPKCR